VLMFKRKKEEPGPLYWYQKGIEDAFEALVKFQPDMAREAMQPFISHLTDSLIREMQLKQRVHELEARE